MTEFDQEILDAIQSRFPIAANPYAELAKLLVRCEEEIISRVLDLKHKGIIRRIGAVFDAAHLGYVSTLVAAEVPQEKIDAFVAQVNVMPGVSHNYGRKHRFNIWFTLTLPSVELIDRTIGDLRRAHGIESIYSLPAESLFKINAEFGFGSESDAGGPDEGAVVSTTCPVGATHRGKCELSELQVNLVRQLQGDIGVVSRPFEAVSEAIGIEQAAVLRQVQQWKDARLIRRFGATVRHQQAGFIANGMVVFTVAPDRVVEAGHLLAKYRQVSHCYQRPTVPDWPYNLFAMTHCRSEADLEAVVQDMVERVKPRDYDVLVSTAEYKKTNVKYFTE